MPFLTAPTRQSGARHFFETMHVITAMDAGMSISRGRRGQSFLLLVDLSECGTLTRGRMDGKIGTTLSNPAIRLMIHPMMCCLLM